MRLYAIDPGAVHVGFAEFREGVCTRVAEYSPTEVVSLASTASWWDAVEVLVLEDFVLEPARAPVLAGSRMETVRLLGVLEYLAGVQGCRVVFQLNKVKRPARAIATSRGVQLRALAERAGGHALDAELHGWYHLHRG